jgi:hypothetical protein
MSDRKAAEDFALAAADRRIAEWRIGACSICGYRTGYVFEEGVVGFDAGCHCGAGRRVEARSWDDVAAHYTMQTSPAVIAEYDSFWGFVPPVPTPERPTERRWRFGITRRTRW